MTDKEKLTELLETAGAAYEVYDSEQTSYFFSGLPDGAITTIGINVNNPPKEIVFSFNIDDCLMKEILELSKTP